MFQCKGKWKRFKFSDADLLCLYERGILRL